MNDELFQIIPDLVLLVDDELTIRDANRLARVILGEDIISLKLDKVIQHSELLMQIKDIADNGVAEEVETSIINQGVYSDYIVNIRKISEGIVLFLHDVTELRRTQQMMRDFVANASHEIRTPLTSIIGFVELLQAMDKGDDEQRKEFLSIVSNQASYISSLVNDLLSLSKIEMNEIKELEDIVNVNDTIKNTIEKISWFARNKNINIVATYGDVPEIKGEIVDLSQVFFNLISNAIKYGKAGTNVYVTSEYVDNKYVAVSVRDEGEGIPMEHLPRLTERFYRIDKVRSRDIEGTGLGLAIVKHILLRYKAHMHIESKVGEGTKFTVYFY